MNLPLRKLNSAYYHYRVNRWRWHPRFRDNDPSVRIDRPIFLLGTQGGGLTLTARILRRHPQVVSVTGDRRHWAGADEMQNVLEGALPEALSWRTMELPGLGSGRNSWLYACDDGLPHYRGDESGASDEVRDEFRSILRRVIRLNAPRSGEGPYRFLDKSQSYTVRIGLIQQILADCGPKFVLLTRNPYAMCWRAVRRVKDLVVMDKPLEEKFEIAVQHWANSMDAALAYEGRADLAWWRFEDLLVSPERVLAEICRFVELPYLPEILPSADDHIPFGSASDAFDRSKWYPLRPGLNDRYLAEIPEWAAKVVSRRCAPLLERFGYESLPGEDG